MNKADMNRVEEIGERVDSIQRSLDNLFYDMGAHTGDLLRAKYVAYEKLRAYKAQQKGLVQNQRLLKAELKELKVKYDRLLAERRGNMDGVESSVAADRPPLPKSTGYVRANGLDAGYGSDDWAGGAPSPRFEEG